MADYRAEAIEVYEKTSSSDTRGIIAALLYLAEGNAPDAATRSMGGGEGQAWRHAALSYLGDGTKRSETAETIRKWLAQQSFEIDINTVQSSMWDLAEADLVKANVNRGSVTFSAIPVQR
ncbi:hypothetical protein ACFWDF_30760 [Streptomyces diastaticus]|uniref:hypothetical protein n=1 Tax=Streptomyces diastaticus TaxID=1956 RepID=UPI00364C8D10